MHIDNSEALMEIQAQARSGVLQFQEPNFGCQQGLNSQINEV